MDAKTGKGRVVYRTPPTGGMPEIAIAVGPAGQSGNVEGEGEGEGECEDKGEGEDEGECESECDSDGDGEG